MNIANKLTVLRILMIPVVIGFLLYGYVHIALGLFVFATLTDFLDGYLARKLNMITNFGKFMDPVADKLLVLSVLMCFVELGKLSSVVVIIIFSRELIISIFRAIAASENIVIAAGFLGKIKTTVQFLMTMLIFIGFEGLYMDIIIWGCAGLTLASGAEYVWNNRKVISDL
ncbi:MAG: CDP-diacylglycerol--glycerol-3-phosphate 3-phosphatidyltransferase [Bacillota bacterium]|nr:CDP-diacylglycerol--glycerol-3-phosphate 3-phosphatidyltransferase [Bacillota bacterium]